MLRAFSGPVVSIPHIIRGYPSDWWQECLDVNFLDCSYEGFSFRQVACLHCCPAILCLISVVVGGGGGGAGFLAGGGERGSHSPVLVVFSGWLP